MSRWASQMGLSLAAFATMVGLGAIGVWLVVIGIAFAGAGVLVALMVYLAWIVWRSRSNHAWR